MEMYYGMVELVVNPVKSQDGAVRGDYCLVVPRESRDLLMHHKPTIVEVKTLFSKAIYETEVDFIDDKGNKHFRPNERMVEHINRNNYTIRVI